MQLALPLIFCLRVAASRFAFYMFLQPEWLLLVCFIVYQTLDLGVLPLLCNVQVVQLVNDMSAEEEDMPIVRASPPNP